MEILPLTTACARLKPQLCFNLLLYCCYYCCCFCWPNNQIGFMGFVTQHWKHSFYSRGFYPFRILYVFVDMYIYVCLNECIGHLVRWRRWLETWQFFGKREKCKRMKSVHWRSLKKPHSFQQNEDKSNSVISFWWNTQTQHWEIPWRVKHILWIQSYDHVYADLYYFDQGVSWSSSSSLGPGRPSAGWA